MTDEEKMVFFQRLNEMETEDLEAIETEIDYILDCRDAELDEIPF